MVPGIQTKRTESRRPAPAAASAASSSASRLVSAMPERLSLASDGWQTWQETRTSPEVAPGIRSSP